MGLKALALFKLQTLPAGKTFSELHESGQPSGECPT